MAGGAREAARALTRVAQLGIGAGIIGFLGQECLYNVDGGEAAVVFDRFRGVMPNFKKEGTHFKIPLIQYPYFFDIKSKPRVIESTTGTKDMQTINIALRVLSRPIPERLPNIYSTLGLDFDERVLPSIGNEVLKAVVAQYNADQLITMREKVSMQIKDTLSKRAETFGIVLDDVSITHLTFGRDFTHAVEAKQVALQDAERSKFVVAKAEQEKQVSIIEAEGEAEAAILISKALHTSGRGLIEVRKIDAAKEIAEKLSKNGRVTYLPGGGNMLLNVPTN